MDYVSGTTYKSWVEAEVTRMLIAKVDPATIIDRGFYSQNQGRYFLWYKQSTDTAWGELKLLPWDYYSKHEDGWMGHGMVSPMGLPSRKDLLEVLSSLPILPKNYDGGWAELPV